MAKQDTPCSTNQMVVGMSKRWSQKASHHTDTKAEAEKIARCISKNQGKANYSRKRRKNSKKRLTWQSTSSPRLI